MFRFALFPILFLAACAPTEPCATMCMSALVEIEPGFEPQLP